MPTFYAHLTGLVLASLGLQALLWGLARLLGFRLRRGSLVGPPLLAFAVLSPRLVGDEILVPTSPLRVLPGAEEIAPGPHDLLSDAVFQFLPWEAEVRRAVFEERVLPLWSARLDGGSSPWVNPQAQVHSPLAWLARAFPLADFFLATWLFKVQAAATGSWILGRRLGLDRRIAAAYATSFAIGGSLLAWALFPQSTALAWIPWVWASYLGVVRDRRPRAVAGAVVTTALLLTAGHPELAGLGGLAAGALALGALRRGRAGRAGLARLVGAGALGFLLTAAVTLPFLEAAWASERAAEVARRPARTWRETPAGPPTWGFDPGSIRLLLSPLGPEVFGRPYWERFRGPINWVEATCGYFGVVGLAGLAAGALKSRPQRRLAVALAAIAGVADLAGARFVPLLWGLDRTPILELVAVTRFLPIGALAALSLGFVGWSRLLRSRRAVRPIPTAILVALGALSLGTAATLTWRTLVPWLLVAFAACAGPIGIPIRAAALLVAVGIDLGNYSRGFLPRGERRDLFPATATTSFLVEQNRLGFSRVGGLGMTAFPSTLSTYGLRDFRVHNPLADAAYVSRLRACCGVDPGEFNYLATARSLLAEDARSFGVRWLVVPRDLASPDGWSLVFVDPRTGTRVVEHPERPTVPGRFVVGLPAGEDGFASPSERVGAVANEPNEPRRAAERRLSLQEAENGLRIDLAAGPGGRFESTLPGGRGWRIASTSGGASAELEPADLLTVRLGEGAGEVELRFRPPGWIAGWWLTGVGALLAGIWFSWVGGARPKVTPHRRNG